jgi:hypothetical protein
MIVLLTIVLDESRVRRGVSLGSYAEAVRHGKGKLTSSSNASLWSHEGGVGALVSLAPTATPVSAPPRVARRSPRVYTCPSPTFNFLPSSPPLSLSLPSSFPFVDAARWAGR